MDSEETWLHRRDAAMPFSTWQPFHSDEIVEVANGFGDVRVGRAGDFWWGYEQDFGSTAEGVIIRARKAQIRKDEEA